MKSYNLQTGSQPHCRQQLTVNKTLTVGTDSISHNIVIKLVSLAAVKPWDKGVRGVDRLRGGEGPSECQSFTSFQPLVPHAQIPNLSVFSGTHVSQ